MRSTLMFFIFVCLVMTKHEQKHTPGDNQSKGLLEVEGGSSSNKEQPEEDSENKGEITYEDVSEEDSGENQVTNSDAAQSGEDVDGKERIGSFLSNGASEDDSSSSTSTSAEDLIEEESKTSSSMLPSPGYQSEIESKTSAHALPSPGGQSKHVSKTSSHTLSSPGDQDKKENGTSLATSLDQRPEEKRCLFVGDLLNFDDIKDYEKEMRFIVRIAARCLENKVQGAIWAYGNTTAELDDQLGKMTEETETLVKDIENTIKYADITGDYSNEKKNANVFGKPFANQNFKKIIVVSLQGANLSKLGGHETINVTDYGDSNVENIVKMIIGFTTTTSKTTMESGTTTDGIDDEILEETKTTRITPTGVRTKPHASSKKHSTIPHPVDDDWGEPGAQKTDSIRRWSFVIAIIVVMVAILIAYLYYLGAKRRVERKRRLAAEARRKRRRVQLRSKSDDKDKKDEPVFMFDTEAKIEGEKTSPNASGQKLIEVRKDAEHENDR